MIRFLFSTILILLISNLFANSTVNSVLNDSLDKKNIVGLNISLIRTPRINFYLSIPSPENHPFFLSYRTEIFYYRKLKRSFFVGVQFGYSDISFKGNDRFNLNNVQYVKYEFNNKLIISNFSVIKDFKITPNFSISPQIDIGVATRIKKIYKEDNLILINKNNSIEEILLLSLQFTYHLTNSQSIYLGYGLRSYTSNMFSLDYLIKGNTFIHNFNFGFRHAF
jgi:hypothetical protein